MKQLAAEAGVGVGTAYRHFASIGDLADAAVAEHLDLLQTALTADGRSAPRDAIEDAAHASLSLMLDNPEIAPQLLLGTSETADRARSQVHQAVARLLHRGLPGLTPTEAQTLATDLQSLLCAVATIARPGPNESQAAHRQLDIILHGLRVQRSPKVAT